MNKEYITISLNELAELIKSDIILGRYKNSIEDFVGYDDLDDSSKSDMNKEIENYIEYYKRCE